ncbi:transcriptional regulator [Leucobacter sp. M11]|nr:transcriptional regulator [Leucobacter sp. M11]
MPADPGRATHPRHRLDEALLTPVRLSLLATLASGDEWDFATLMVAVDADAPPVSKGLATLEAAGYVRTRKDRSGARPRTWAAATPAGIAALRVHLGALREIAAALPPPEHPEQPEDGPTS